MKSVLPAVAGGHWNGVAMTPMNANQNVEAQYRSLLIVWGFLFLSVAGFFLLTVLIGPTDPSENKVLAIVILVLGLSNVSLSFSSKKSFLAQSVARQDPTLVTRAYVLALALCESAALFGVIIHFMTGSLYYYAGFAMGVLGMLLHFPKKQHVLDATFKKL